MANLISQFDLFCLLMVRRFLIPSSLPNVPPKRSNDFHAAFCVPDHGGGQSSEKVAALSMLSLF